VCALARGARHLPSRQPTLAIYKEVGEWGLRLTCRLHPTMKSHMLALVRRDSCFTSGASSDCAEDLYVTSTFGQTWTNLTANANVRPAVPVPTRMQLLEDEL
jgi:hypothetical protein